MYCLSTTRDQSSKQLDKCSRQHQVSRTLVIVVVSFAYVNGQVYIYDVLAIDACFRLKRKQISSWNRDPSLQDGWAYFVENKPFLDWIESMKDQKEVSTLVSYMTLLKLAT